MKSYEERGAERTSGWFKHAADRNALVTELNAHDAFYVLPPPRDTDAVQ